MIKKLLLVLMLVTSGCSATHPIPETFRPLEEIAQRPFWMGDSITTLDTTVWVNNIDDYLALKPEGSVIYNSDMIHERIHSLRQDGLFNTILFALNYIWDAEFMWQEESIAWYYQLMYLASRNRIKPPEYTAAFLSSGYFNMFGTHMISYEDALQWVKDVYAGRWKPNITPKEHRLYYTEVLERINAN